MVGTRATLGSGTTWTERGHDVVTRATEWLFLTGHRLTIAVGLSAVVYLLLVAADVTVGSISREQMGPLNYLFGALVGGNFTLITIVLSINQLVISRQLGTPGELRDQIEATNSYREEIEQTLPDLAVAPVTPTEFLHVLLRSCTACVERLLEEAERGERAAGSRASSAVRSASDGGTPEAWAGLAEVVDRIGDHVERVESVLSREDVDLFAALAVTLYTNYSRDIYRLRQLRADHASTYPDAVVEDLDRVVVRLEQIDVARQYIKTLYIQNELSRLSRQLLYVGVPAVLVSVFVLRAFAVGVGTFSPADLFAFVPLTVTVSVAPLAVLFAYVLRLSTVARRTVAITPFTTATQEVADGHPLEGGGGDG